MKIKDRIALYFTLISTTMLFAVLFTIYLTFMKFLQADFFERLTDRTMVTAKLYLEADEISRDALNDVRHKYLQKLNGEVTRIYDYKNRATFIGDAAQYWTKSTIEKVRKNGRLQYTEGERQVVGIYYKDNQGDFVILASAYDSGSHNSLNKLLKIMIFVFILISVIVLLLSRWIANKMLKPLHQFMLEVNKVGSKNMEFRVAETDNKDEINLIAKSFNQLMEELEQAFILQKTFVANASHELRTPLTRMIMAGELSLTKDRTPEEYQTVLNTMLEDTSKMEHIITGLLTLAKMDLELIRSQMDAVNLVSILLNIQANWQKQENLAVRLIFNIPKETEALISANTVLLQIALDNIISNGFKFSNQQEITCTLSHLNNNFMIQIHDQGPGIPEGERNEVFKPFYTRSQDSGYHGEGMGLYMAHKIIDLFSGQIAVTDKKNPGCTITITLPKL
jgi:signal transduction histidine kinase